MAGKLNNLKHIKYFKNYIAEQEAIEADPAAMVGGEAQMAPAPVEPVYTFLFIAKGESGDDNFPDGSSVKKFPTYEVPENALNKWIDQNIKTSKSDPQSESALKVKKKAIFEFITGTKDQIAPDDMDLVEKFKNAANTEMVGRRIADTEVIFSPGKKEPTTDVVDVTFIITNK